MLKSYTILFSLPWPLPLPPVIECDLILTPPFPQKDFTILRRRQLTQIQAYTIDAYCFPVSSMVSYSAQKYIHLSEKYPD